MQEDARRCSTDATVRRSLPDINVHASVNNVSTFSVLFTKCTRYVFTLAQCCSSKINRFELFLVEFDEIVVAGAIVNIRIVKINYIASHRRNEKTFHPRSRSKTLKTVGTHTELHNFFVVPMGMCIPP